MKLIGVLIVIAFSAQVESFTAFSKLYKDHGKLLKAPLDADVGDPLILTTYLKDGQIEEGRQAALVQNEIFQDVESYSGYFTVDAAFDSNIFFWFFPSTGNVSTDPVVLWLNGGPGATSMNGLFDENGPFIVNSDGSVSLREYSWHNNHSVIFIDQPVGTGFSFTNGGEAQNETKVGEDMYSALLQFFQLFPELQTNPFYISGESYAGKYLPAIGYTILHKNPTAGQKLNLQGVLLGDGWVDPIHQLGYGPFLYEVGLVSAEIRDKINYYEDLAVKAINASNWDDANVQSGLQMYLINHHTGVNIYNYLYDYPSDSAWVNFLNTEEVRKAIHVGNTQFGDKGAASALEEDVPHSIAPWMEEVLDNYRVIVYTGQVDIICGYPMTLDYLTKLSFNGADAYKEASRNFWYVDKELAGYVRTGGNLVELLVRNAGHLLPMDQPKWAFDMLYRFTRNQTFS
ncbi:hypothetical protein ABEB36_001483 [Hypothenemus hampei]|uniref:Carboxypeptidase n=1 Tax=Hypothenemus hampei TaxID=57062 RepID=A0ABD1FFC6_HYPHA